jgi:hypothetical protein
VVVRDDDAGRVDDEPGRRTAAAPAAAEVRAAVGRDRDDGRDVLGEDRGDVARRRAWAVACAVAGRDVDADDPPESRVRTSVPDAMNAPANPPAVAASAMRRTGPTRSGLRLEGLTDAWGVGGVSWPNPPERDSGSTVAVPPDRPTRSSTVPSSAGLLRRP